MEGETGMGRGLGMLSNYDKRPHMGSDEIRLPGPRMAGCDQIDL
jgi:hypothetical protein